MDQARNCLCQKELQCKRWSPVAPWSFATTSSMRTPRYISKPTNTNMNGTGLLRFWPSHLISLFWMRSLTSKPPQEDSLVSPMWFRRLKQNRIESSNGCLSTAPLEFPDSPSSLSASCFNRSAVYYTRIFEGLNHLSALFLDFGKHFLPRIPFIFRLMLGAPTTPAAVDCNTSEASV